MVSCAPKPRFPRTAPLRVASCSARFAETFPVFNPAGNPIKEKARICALTFACSAEDPHPTDAGYRAIAAAVFAASGYTDS